MPAQFPPVLHQKLSNCCNRPAELRSWKAAPTQLQLSWIQLTGADIGAGAPGKMVSAMGALLRRGRALSYSYCHTQSIWASTRLASTTARPSREGRVGPDRVLPANSFTSTYPDGRVEIRYSDRDPRCAEKPISVWTMLNNTADRVPDNVALAVKRNDVWVNWTYRYLLEVKTLSSVLQSRPFPRSVYIH